MEAPVVVSKGRDLTGAKNQGRCSLAGGIPIMENPPLAQALYRTCRGRPGHTRETLHRRRRNPGRDIPSPSQGAAAGSDCGRESKARGARIEMNDKTGWLATFRGMGTEWLLPAAAVAMVFVMLVPLPSMVLDLLLAVSLTVSVMVLLTALNILKPVEFSVFPSLLLLLTLAPLVAGIWRVAAGFCCTATKGRPPPDG